MAIITQEDLNRLNGSAPASGGTTGTITKSTKATAAPVYTPPIPNSVPFVQNPYVSHQASQFGQIPQWMQNAFAQKMAGYGVQGYMPNFNNRYTPPAPTPTVTPATPQTGGKTSQPTMGSSLASIFQSAQSKTS